MHLILDTSYIVAVANERDQHHPKVKPLQREIAAGVWKPILTDSVLFETANVLLGRRGPEFAVRTTKLILAEDTRFVNVGPRMSQALRYFESHAQHGLGLTDCSLVAVAKEFRAKAIATFDADFAAVRGLRVLPEP